MADEAVSLRGGFLRHPSLGTVHATPSFIRSSGLRVSTGFMLGSAVMSTLCALMDTEFRFDCILSAAVCWVATYHYSALTNLRAQSYGVVKLVAPGAKEDDFSTPTPLRIAFQDASADAIRYSDWLVRPATPLL